MSDWMLVPKPARGWWWKRLNYLDPSDPKRSEVVQPVQVLGVLDDGETVVFDYYPIWRSNVDEEAVRATKVCVWKKIEEA